MNNAERETCQWALRAWEVLVLLTGAAQFPFQLALTLYTGAQPLDAAGMVQMATFILTMIIPAFGFWSRGVSGPAIGRGAFLAAALFFFGSIAGGNLTHRLYSLYMQLAPARLQYWAGAALAVPFLVLLLRADIRLQRFLRQMTGQRFMNN